MINQSDVDYALKGLLNESHKSRHPEAHRVINELWAEVSARRAWSTTMPIDVTAAMVKAAREAYYATDFPEVEKFKEAIRAALAAATEIRRCVTHVRALIDKEPTT